MKQVLLIIALFCWSNLIISQSNYIELSSSRGIDYNSIQMDSLESASDRVSSTIQLFASEYISNFKVISFDFYLHDNATYEQIELAFENAINNSNENYDNYLLVGKHISNINICDKIYIKLIASLDSFSCLNPENIAISLQNAANSYLQQSNDIFLVEHKIINHLDYLLEDGFCCSGYYSDFNNNASSFRQSSNVCLDQDLILAAINRIKDSPVIDSFIQELLKIYSFYEACEESEWKSFTPGGIVPGCFWQEYSGSPSYLFADLPFTAGVIDGLYVEFDDTKTFLLSIDDFAKSLTNIFYSFTVYYLKCPSSANLAPINLNKLMFMQVLEALKNDNNWQSLGFKENFDELYLLFDHTRWLVSQLCEFFGSSDCETWSKIRNTTFGLASLITKIEYWDNVYKDLKDEASDLFENINGFSNAERYYQGYYGIRAISFLLPFEKASHFRVIDNYIDDLISKLGESSLYYTTQLGTFLTNQLFKDIIDKLNLNQFTPLQKQLLSASYYNNYNGLKIIDENNLYKYFQELDYPEVGSNPDLLLNAKSLDSRAGYNIVTIKDEIKVYEDGPKIYLQECEDTVASGLYEGYPFGVGNLSPFKRGRELEDVLGRNLHPNCPHIDKFVSDGHGGSRITSIKSTDIYCKTYNDLQNLEIIWKKYIDKLAGMPKEFTFNGQTFANFTEKILEIAVPNTLSFDEEEVLQSVINYAKNKGPNQTDIKIIITVIE